EHPPAPSLFPRPLTLEAVDGAFGAIAAAQGPASRRTKQSVLRSLLRDAAPLEAKFLVKILTSDLRIGFREGLLLPAIAQAFGRDADAVRQEAPLVGLARDYILDGEIVAWRGDRPLPFGQLQRRLGRLTPGPLAQEIPVVLMAFDLLRLDGGELLQHPLEARRSAMTGLAWDESVRLSRAAPARTPAEAEARFREAREAGHEGIVLKSPQSPYQPGRRGRLWLKWKPGLGTLDVVVVAAEYGHGKRARVLSDYTFAVRAAQGLVTIGKAYSGLTDDEIARLTAWFLAHTVEDLGRVRTVEPRIVLEVAFDKIMVSGRHTSGSPRRRIACGRYPPQRRHRARDGPICGAGDPRRGAGPRGRAPDRDGHPGRAAQVHG